MIRHSLLITAIAFFALGCQAADSGDAPEESEPTPLPSSYADNGYPNILEENADYTGDGSQERQFIHGFEMVDQHGNTVDFRQFLGYVVILDVSAEWCPPCRAAAETAQEVADEIQELGPAYYVQIISQNWDGDPATQETAAGWAEDFGLDLPVLADANEAFAAQIELRSYPTFMVIRPDGEIVHRQGGALTDDGIVAWVEYMLRDSDSDDFREIPGWPDPDAEHEDD